MGITFSNYTILNTKLQEISRDLRVSNKNKSVFGLDIDKVK